MKREDIRILLELSLFDFVAFSNLFLSNYLYFNLVLIIMH